MTQEYHDNMDNRSQQSDDSDEGIQCNQHSAEQTGKINSESHTGSNIIKGSNITDMNNVNEIHTVAKENVVNLIDP